MSSMSNSHASTVPLTQAQTLRWREAAPWQLRSAPRSALGGLPAILAGCSALIFLACYIRFDARPAIAWAVLTITAAGTTAIRRLRANGVLDPLGLFALCFVAYNGVLLLRLATLQEPSNT